MGIDFIKAAAKSFERRWEDARKRVEEPDLFGKPTVKFRNRTYSAVPLSNHDFVIGEECIAQLTVNKRGIELISAGDRIGLISNPSETLLKELELETDACGAALGKVEKTHELSGTADISLN